MIDLMLNENMRITQNNTNDKHKFNERVNMSVIEKCSYDF